MEPPWSETNLETIASSRTAPRNIIQFYMIISLKEKVQQILQKPIKTRKEITKKRKSQIKVCFDNVLKIECVLTNHSN